MLIEPVALSDFFLSFFSAAMIILTAALYAALFAWSKISSRRYANIFAGLSYVVLVLCIVVFSVVNHFSDYWLILSLVMALGYAFMPLVVWRLCVATHIGQADR